MQNTLDTKFDNFEDWFNHNQAFFINENLSTKTIAGLAWEHAWYKIVIDNNEVYDLNGFNLTVGFKAWLNDNKKMASPAPADICKGCDHYSPIDNTFTCKGNGNSVEYEGEENEDCSLYIPHNKNDGDEYYG